MFACETNDIQRGGSDRARTAEHSHPPAKDWQEVNPETRGEKSVSHRAAPNRGLKPGKATRNGTSRRYEKQTVNPVQHTAMSGNQAHRCPWREIGASPRIRTDRQHGQPARSGDPKNQSAARASTQKPKKDRFRETRRPACPRKIRPRSCSETAAVQAWVRRSNGLPTGPRIGGPDCDEYPQHEICAGWRSPQQHQCDGSQADIDWSQGMPERRTVCGCADHRNAARRARSRGATGQIPCPLKTAT